MPRPVYILVAHGISEDKDTNLVSIFSVIETINTFPNRKSAKDAPPQRPTIPANYGVSRIIAVWKKEPDDAGVFEHQFVIDFGMADGPVEAFVGEFEFDATKPLKRFILTIQGFPTPSESRDVFVISRVRRKDSKEWYSQDYPITVNVVSVPES